MKRLFRDALIGAAAPVAHALYRERPRVRVLVIHDTPPALERTLRDRLEWLRRNAEIVSLARAFERTDLDRGRLNVALTFDDGLKDHHDVAAAVLADFGLGGTFFVPTGAVGLRGAAAAAFSRNRLRRSKEFAFMTDDDVRALAAEPSFEIGGHTHSHPDLAEIDDLDAEVRDPKARLEALTGRPVRWFAYPFGSPSHASARAVAAIRTTGHDAAFTIVPSFWSAADDPFLVGRDALNLDEPLGSWRRFLNGGYDMLSALKYRRALASLRRAGA